MEHHTKKLLEAFLSGIFKKSVIVVYQSSSLGGILKNLSNPKEIWTKPSPIEILLRTSTGQPPGVLVVHIYRVEKKLLK